MPSSGDASKSKKGFIAEDICAVYRIILDQGKNIKESKMDDGEDFCEYLNNDQQKYYQLKIHSKPLTLSSIELKKSEKNGCKIDGRIEKRDCETVILGNIFGRDIKIFIESRKGTVRNRLEKSFPTKWRLINFEIIPTIEEIFEDIKNKFGYKDLYILSYITTRQIEQEFKATYSFADMSKYFEEKEDSIYENLVNNTIKMLEINPEMKIERNVQLSLGYEKLTKDQVISLAHSLETNPKNIDSILRKLISLDAISIEDIERYNSYFYDKKSTFKNFFSDSNCMNKRMWTNSDILLLSEIKTIKDLKKNKKELTAKIRRNFSYIQKKHKSIHR